MMKLCGRCHKPIQYPKKYCDDCKLDVSEQQRAGVTQSNRKYNRNRNPKYVRFYKGSKWTALSRAYMLDQLYRCECCNGIATEVHHINPIQSEDGWEQRYEWTNLMAVCVKCHNKQHQRFTEKQYTIV